MARDPKFAGTPTRTLFNARAYLQNVKKVVQSNAVLTDTWLEDALDTLTSQVEKEICARLREKADSGADLTTQVLHHEGRVYHRDFWTGELVELTVHEVEDLDPQSKPAANCTITIGSITVEAFWNGRFNVDNAPPVDPLDDDEDDEDDEDEPICGCDGCEAEREQAARQAQANDGWRMPFNAYLNQAG